MNSTLQIIKNHRSIRSYLDKDLPADVLQAIVDAAQAMPTSINGQQVSLVIVRDKDTRLKLAELCGGQPWVAAAPVFVLFVADFYKTSLAAEINGRTQVIHESVEGGLVGVLDCGIAMGGMIVAAESLGLGIVPIGGIRLHAKEVIELLGLPKYTFPVNGLCVGYPADESKLKPRLPQETFAHYEKYAASQLLSNIKAYDVTMEAYLATIGRTNEGNWSKQTSNSYQQVYFPNVKPTMTEQGLLHNK
jgi:FMN reductase [NAD(P)H]